jgi:hypothetical protein
MDVLLEDFSYYYSLDELERLKEEQKEKLRACITTSDLFVYSVLYGLENLAEYLYIYCDISFEINDLLTKTGVSSDKVILNQDVPQVVPNYLNQTDKNKLRVFNRLLNLRKYSKLESKDKKFIYRFNKKYLN